MFRMKLALIVFAMASWSGFAWAQNSLAFYRADYETFVGGDINHLAAADFNRDGKLDVAIGYEGSGVSVSLGNGDGTFQAAQYFTEPGAQNSCIGDGVDDIVAGDFNGDGHADLVVASGQVLCLIPGNGDGTFGPPQTLLTGLDEELFGGFLAMGDFNKDGNLDLVVLVGSGGTGEPQSKATVLLGHGNGVFTASDIFEVPTNQYASQVAVGDFNGDGALDVAVTTQSWLLFGASQPPQTTFYVALGRGDGSFSPPITSPQTVTPGLRSLLLATDVNGDGKVDLIVEPTASGLSIMLGNGDGTFGYPINAGWFGSALAVADFDGDGKPDIALDYNGPAVANGVGDGTFITPEYVAPFPKGFSVYSMLAADINGDGKPDLITTTDIGLEVRINASAPTPAPFAVTTAASGILSAAPASIASMYGLALATGTVPATTLPLPFSLGGSSVMVNDSLGVSRPAPLYYASPTQINFEIPAGSAPGIATLEVDNGPTTLTSTAWILNTLPALFGSAAGYTITYGPENQAQAPVPIQTCSANGCAFNPIGFPSGSRVFLVLYGTGIRNASAVTCVIDGQSFPVSFAGAQGVDEGLDQVNIELTSAMLLCGGGNCFDQIAVVTDGGISNPVDFW